MLLPFLGQQYGEVLDAGELRWEYVDGGFALRYFEHCFPLAPPTYALLLDGAQPPSLASFAPLFAALRRCPSALAGATPPPRYAGCSPKPKRTTHARTSSSSNAARTTAAGKALIERVIEVQHWRPASWKVAAEEINYRRFFDINGLAALRMEHAALLWRRAPFRFRADRPRRCRRSAARSRRRLYDPIGYCDLLRSRAQLLGQPMYLVIEKILAPNEELLARWHVDGTTGYEFLNAVTGLAIDPRARARASTRSTALHRRHAALRRGRVPLEAAGARQPRCQASSTCSRCGSTAWRSAIPHTRDFTLGALRRACSRRSRRFRSIAPTSPAPWSTRRQTGTSSARSRRLARQRPVQRRLGLRVLAARSCWPSTHDDAVRERYVEFAMRFQQLTAPVTAKGVEDTALLPVDPADGAQRGRRRSARDSAPRSRTSTGRTRGARRTIRTRCWPPRLTT